jgi:hypothetical protein
MILYINLMNSLTINLHIVDMFTSSTKQNNWKLIITALGKTQFLYRIQPGNLLATSETISFSIRIHLLNLVI